MYNIPLTRLLSLTATALIATAAVAHPSYDLRVFALGIEDSAVPGDPALIDFVDLFNDGDPLHGGAFSGAITGSGSYTAHNNGFSAGSELTGPASDWAGQEYGIGRLRMQSGDAMAVPNNLVPPGTVTLRNSLQLDDPGSGPLLNRMQSFWFETSWEFIVPEPGSGYGSQVSDRPLAAGAAFDNSIDLWVVPGGGNPAVQFRRVTYDGASTYAIPQGMGFPIASALDIGRTLDDVAYIDLLIHFDAARAGPPLAGAFFAVYDADGNPIGSHDFPVAIDIFTGEDFTRGAAVARWLTPVPEPATWVLWLGGLAALAARRGCPTPCAPRRQ